MAVVFNIILPVLAGIAILAMFYFIGRAFAARSKASHQAYNVGKQEALKSSRVNLVRAVFALIIGLIILGAVGIRPVVNQSLPSATATPVVETPELTVEATLPPTATEATATLQPSPTLPEPTATNTPLPTLTSTPEPLTATVSSGVGVYLRVEPSVDAEQLEWLLEGTELIVLDGRQTIDDLLWQQVQSESGLVGWVASDFIVVNEP
ncbi:MAG: SH3 domain-containing protein [Candidatus Promineifilaceae bacterium]|nr:SH3 domain-containing protein [Candidatus Promineifilaceae bacterium]